MRYLINFSMDINYDVEVEADNEEDAKQALYAMRYDPDDEQEVGRCLLGINRIEEL